MMRRTDAASPRAESSEVYQRLLNLSCDTSEIVEWWHICNSPNLEYNPEPRAKRIKASESLGE